jgi:hypothetical protein
VRTIIARAMKGWTRFTTPEDFPTYLEETIDALLRRG